MKAANTVKRMGKIAFLFENQAEAGIFEGKLKLQAYVYDPDHSAAPETLMPRAEILKIPKQCP